VDDANELMRIYSVAVDSLISLDVDNVNQVLAARDEARKIFWERTGDILLVLSLNQPMMGDLRMISTFLRGSDTIERGMRHARDISQTSSLLANQLEIDKIPQSGLNIEYISNKWEEIGNIWETCQEVISVTPGAEIGSKTGRLNLFRAISRMERTGYNFVRFADHWHHALNNEWISIEN
ncbi:MAG: PhoU domain-containing protein, partial [Euryarchaeota archaeon]